MGGQDDQRQISSRAAQVRGVVRDAAGKPRNGLPVTLWRLGSNFNTVPSNPDGSFEFGNLAPGNYGVAVWDGLRTQPAGWGGR